LKESDAARSSRVTRSGTEGAVNIALPDCPRIFATASKATETDREDRIRLAGHPTR
jgi:hypothetical protein